MNQLLVELFQHQSWADSQHWQAFETFPKALEDEALRKRLHHIHLVQHAFYAATSGKKPERTRFEDFVATTDLKFYAQRFHDAAIPFIKSLTDEQLNHATLIPWFKNPPLDITIHQALMQCVMHSQHHRGQNATRLRELGGEPPTTDLIVWYWKGKPEVKWE